MGGKGAVMTLAPTEGNMDVKKHMYSLYTGRARLREKNHPNK
jgi:hypothetical protein